jgi:hypothetical protein
MMQKDDTDITLRAGRALWLLITKVSGFPPRRKTAHYRLRQDFRSLLAIAQQSALPRTIFPLARFFWLKRLTDETLGKLFALLTLV